MTKLASPAIWKTPVTIVTGFLGAGKTTLIRHVLEHANGRRLALIVNEFGDVGVDGEILRACGIESCPEDNIVELANGCLCCTVADDFMPAIEALLGRDDSAGAHHHRDLRAWRCRSRLLKAFDWPAIRSRLTVDGVIAVVDGAAVAAGRFADDPAKLARQRAADPSVDHDNPLEEVYEDQLLCADLVVLNKTDLLIEATLARVRREIAGAVPRAVKVVETREGRIEPAVLLGLWAAAEDDLDARPSHHDAEDGHDHDDFESFVVEMPAIAGSRRLRREARALARDARRAAHEGLRRRSPASRCGCSCRVSATALPPAIRPALGGGRGEARPARRDRREGPRPGRLTAAIIAAQQNGSLRRDQR